MTERAHGPFRRLTLALLAALAAWTGDIQASDRAKAGITVTVVEYHHAAFDHYFVTGVPDEILQLDAGAFAGWARTGRQFSTFATGTPGTVPTCRFFSASFAPKSSHFYTPFASECTALRANPDWQFEGEVFNVALPDDAGSCAAGTAPLYRLYNDGRSGAPNHRFVTSLDLRQAMLDQGYVAEGTGVGVGMCIAAPNAGVTTAEGLWSGTTASGRLIRIVVLDDGKFFLLHSRPTGPYFDGVVHGSSTSLDGTFTATTAHNIPSAVDLVRGSLRIDGAYVAGASLQLTIRGASSTETVSASYDASYAIPASVAALAGRYEGKSGHLRALNPDTTVVTIDALGNMGMTGECAYAGTVVPRGSTSVFDWTVESLGGPCLGGAGRIRGILHFDEASRTFRAFAPFADGADVLTVVATRQ